MFTEENSKLISSLYNAKTRPEVADALELMGESGDGIFIYPMLDGYKRFKNTTIGYYFLWNMSRLDYPELGKRLNDLLESYEIQKDHIPMALEIMAERRFSSPIADKMAAMYIESYTDPEFRKDFKTTSTGLGCVAEYATRAGISERVEEGMRAILFDSGVGLGAKNIANTFLFTTQPKRHLDFLLVHYADRIRGTELEAGIAKELIFCDAANARALKKLMRSGGEEPALRILERGEAMEGLARRVKREGLLYDNVQIVLRIGILRSQINCKALVSDLVGLELFPETELLVSQYQSVDDEEIFFSLCEELHRAIRLVNPELLKRSRADKQAVLQLTAFYEENDLARLFLYLINQGVAVDRNFFGFKNLDRGLVDLLTRREDPAFYERLKRLGIDQLYRDRQWHKIHGFFLNYYAQVLETMNRNFSLIVSPELDA